MHLKGILKARRRLEFEKADRTGTRRLQQELLCNQINRISLKNSRADYGTDGMRPCMLAWHGHGVDGIRPLDLSTNQKSEGDAVSANHGEDPMANAEMELCQKLDGTILDDNHEADTEPTFDEFS